MAEAAQKATTTRRGKGGEAASRKARASQAMGGQVEARGLDLPTTDHQNISAQQAGAALREAMAAQANRDEDARDDPPVDQEGGEEIDELEAISQALTGEPGDDQGDDEATEVPPAATDRELSIDAIAEVFGVPLEDVFRTLEVALPGELGSRTLSELKDAYSESIEHEQDREAWATERQEQVTQLAKERAEVAELLRMIGPAGLSPQMRAEAAARVEAAQEEAARETLSRIPEWKDDQRRDADRQVMVDHIAPHGFSPEDLDAVMNGKLMAYVRHNALREQRIAKALKDAAERKKRRASRTRTTQTPGTGTRQTRAPSTRADKAAAAARALKGT